ncbi:mechanosensitive ion channel [Microcoleus sp. Pol11C3]|uniref:mechanosensitive ion channel domain-containing protein n=1 Tax=Microcoleus sp. Pol11C3 TaxID=3055390 RepID=UPI002FD2AB9B
MAGSSIACVIVFSALRPGNIIGLLGLDSVAISFAFQDIFKNFLSGILLLLHEPFLWGDQIFVEGFEGTVEKISMRSTHILTDRGERVIVPKAIVLTNSAIGRCRNQHRCRRQKPRLRVGEWERGRVGKIFLLTSSLFLLTSSLFLLTFQIKQKASRFSLSAPANLILFYQT